ncbi:MFS transporter [Pseudomaricurvus sp. HS19]|uniref:MFS transporter n=1 Tax=Pseudomaricurvus sp. HS19 TaxID=2692626 RepID=UPI00136DFCDF|nr:MFS transporter [Pseudomaricurvus sp. HS19]MYM61906.1 MFS transporter [Pseudomaricurvus sp. HS19]
MQSPLFYSGWRVLAGSFLSSALAIGFSMYIFGMFTVPVTEEFGLSRASFNNGVIILMLGIALASPLVGKLLDRYPARIIMGVCGTGFGLALVLIAAAQQLWQMLVLLAIPLAFGVAACGALGANTVVVRWFQVHRGKAMGILALSTSVGGFLSQPITAWLITNFGWRGALVILGIAITTIFVLLNLFVIRSRPSPADKGYDAEFAVNTETDSATTQAGRAIDNITWGHLDLLKSRNFWLVSIGIGLFFGIDQAVLVSQVAYFQDIGYDLQTTALLVSIKTISAIGGKLIVGHLADKVDLRILFAGVACCSISLLTVYILQPDYWILLSCVAAFGVAVGGVYPVWTTLTAWLFGTRSYGAVMGLMVLFTQPFAMVALRFIGQIHDSYGTYIPAFFTFIALVGLAICMIALVRPTNPADAPAPTRA